MLFFGYIVSDVTYNDLKEDVVRVVNSLEECTRNMPKLIIGLDSAKSYASKNGWEFDILNHTFPNGDMWTFKKTEKREMYEEDVIFFKKNIVEQQAKFTRYTYVSIFMLGYNKLKKLHQILFSNGLKKRANYIIVDNNMIYMPLNDVDVIGVSLNQMRYIGINSEKVLKKIKKEKANKIYYTTSKNMWKFKDWFKGREYVIANIFERNTLKSN